MPGRPLYYKHDDWTLTPEESRRLTRNVWRLTSPQTRDPVALHCRLWNRLNGNIAQDPVTDVEGVRKRWER